MVNHYFIYRANHSRFGLLVLAYAVKAACFPLKIDEEGTESQEQFDRNVSRVLGMKTEGIPNRKLAIHYDLSTNVENVTMSSMTEAETTVSEPAAILEVVHPTGIAVRSPRYWKPLSVPIVPELEISVVPGDVLQIPLHPQIHITKPIPESLSDKFPTLGFKPKPIKPPQLSLYAKIVKIIQKVKKFLANITGLSSVTPHNIDFQAYNNKTIEIIKALLMDARF